MTSIDLLLPPVRFSRVRAVAETLVGDCPPMMQRLSTHPGCVAPGVRSAGLQAVQDYTAKKNVEILEMPEVLQFLIETRLFGRSAGSESEHVIRLMKIYGLVLAIGADSLSV